jgi:hypothetical protein
MIVNLESSLWKVRKARVFVTSTVGGNLDLIGNEILPYQLEV